MSLHFFNVIAYSHSTTKLPGVYDYIKYTLVCMELIYYYLNLNKKLLHASTSHSSKNYL